MLQGSSIIERQGAGVLTTDTPDISPLDRTVGGRRDKKIKALLIGNCLPYEDMTRKEASMRELERLADTAGIVSLGRYVQRRKKRSPRTYAGEGFIRKHLEEAGHRADILIFDNDLTGSQSRNIEKILSIEAIDRTELILRIFHNKRKPIKW